MRETTWNSGSLKESGAGYGVRIPKDCRETYFDCDWNLVILHIEDTTVEIKLNATFWSACNELRSKEIGNYLKKQGMAKWGKSKPHVLELISCGDRAFKLEV